MKGLLTMNILLADPNEEVAVLMNLYLTENGHKTKRVQNAAEVIKEYETGEYDKVILSLTVPLSDNNIKNQGGGAVKELKAKFPKAPILIASGFSLGQLVEMGIEDSPSLKYIEKPFTQDQFIKAINS
jgi:CheY-like chemotaxis protein